MKELTCLDCNKQFDPQHGHCCLNSRWMLKIGDGINRMHKIMNSQDLEGQESFSVPRQQIPRLPSVSSDIFSRNHDSYTNSSLSRQVTSETVQHTSSCSENSVKYNKCSVTDFQAVPGPSRLTFSESTGSVCQKEFQSKPNQAESINVIQSASNVCDKVFKPTDSFRKRMQNQEGEKEHRCDFCGKSFQRKTDLQRHTRVHTGEKPFICAVCGNRYQRKSHLTRHNMISHNGPKFSCEICGKLYAQKLYLKMHARQHADEKLYECDTSGK
ncbi:zinc finger protein 624-like [Argiope bruennichi]|uniref:zinc finger protein 624-like n=1 Tax=Argiope bruennichi TaxID=94029 RepID=UPI0024950FA8|nr:zinc finger protein 624-like [Argiope bruennichi]